MLFLLEFLVVPGITIAGIGGILMLAAAVYLSFAFYDTTTGLIVLVGVFVVIVLTTILALRARTWRRISLATDIHSNVGDVKETGVAVGDTGIALTRLAPIGTVVINDQKLEGHSEGPYIDQKTPVEVLRVSTTYVIVKPIEKK